MTGDRSALGRSAKPHSPGDVRLSLDLFIHLFCFVSLLLIGADRWGIELIGVNFRVDQLFLCIFALLLVVKKAYRFTFNGWIAAFLFLSLISTLFAVSIMRGILFYCSIVYNVLFLFYALASYVKCYGFGMFIRIFRMTMKVQFFILLFQFVLKLVTGYEFSFLPSYGEYMGIYRFQIWFYEPSYLATYLVLWFSFSLMQFLLRGRREYLVDLLMCLAMFLMSTSTSGFIGIALTVVVVYCMWLARGVTAKKLIFPVILLAIFLVLRIVFASMFDVFLGRLFDSSLNEASGGRIDGWKETWKVFLENPFFGVGPGNYGLYLGQEAGYVPTNVSFELLATLGIGGFLAFYGLTASLFVRAAALYRRERSESAFLILAFAVALILFTLILQINQGYLRLYHWMAFGVLAGALERERMLKKYSLAEVSHA